MTNTADLIPLIPEEEAARRLRRQQSANPELWQILDSVMDPEIPVITLYELGVLQDVYLEDDGAVHLVITPTYMGCPAMKVMEEDSREALAAAGFDRVNVETRLAPAWTTAWLTPESRQKMATYGVAAPSGQTVHCPQCNSEDVAVISEFGSTACKALYRCKACGEPFDLFKAI